MNNDIIKDFLLQRFGLQTRQDKISLENWKYICSHDDNFSKTLANWLWIKQKYNSDNKASCQLVDSFDNLGFKIKL